MSRPVLLFPRICILTFPEVSSFLSFSDSFLLFSLLSTLFNPYFDGLSCGTGEGGGRSCGVESGEERLFGGEGNASVIISVVIPSPPSPLPFSADAVLSFVRDEHAEARDGVAGSGKALFVLLIRESVRLEAEAST